MDLSETTMNTKSTWKYVVKSVVFFAIFIALFLGVSRIMTIDTSNYEYLLIKSIYEEEPDSLDAVYIGSSNCFTFWNSLAAFGEYGIAVMPFSCNSLPFIATEQLIREARKTQPDALYIVNVNTARESGPGDIVMHRILDYMPFSLEKLKFTSFLAEASDISRRNRAEYYLPLIRYHSRWDELKPSNLQDMSRDFKNSFEDDYYFYVSKDISEGYTATVDSAELNETLQVSLESLLNYCDEESVKVLFVTVPQNKPIEDVYRFNRINEIVASRGYPVLDLLSDIEKTGIHTATDFSDNGHTNLHGSLKFTHYLSKYLIKHYGFTDKRQNTAYNSWHESLAEYMQSVSQCALDFEFDRDSRNLALEQVEHVEAQGKGESVGLSWQSSVGASGYAVYRKSGGAWELIEETNVCKLIDENVEVGAEYTYTVVPYTETEEGKHYGNFSYTGLAVTVPGKE